MAYLEVEPGKHVYYEHHRGSGPPIVLVHGWGMSARVWDLNLPALLDAGHEVIALDHRCCGSSDKDFDEMSIRTVASDVVALITATGVKDPIVVGWSFGCAAVAEAVGQLGSAVRGIVLIGPPTPRYTQAEGFPHGGTAEVMEQTLTALRDTRPEFLFTLSGGVCHQDLGAHTVEWMWRIFMQGSPRANAGLADLGVVDQRELLPTLQMPALICVGDHDAIVDPAIAERAAELLPHSRVVRFADSGHGLFLDEREKFNAELLAFARDPQPAAVD